MDESIIHFGGIRLRINGIGNLRATFYSLDRIRNHVLVPIPMEIITDREPTRLANFTTQRAVLRLETNAISEYMNVNRVIVYTKLMYTQFPG